MKAELKPEELRATDLRIGNYVRRKSTGEEFAIDVMKIAVIESDNHGIYEASFEPIELSEEWLKKAGFESKQINTQDGPQPYWIKNENGKYFEIAVWANSVHGPNVFMYDDSLTVHIASVHQLQNLFYALTGNELIFNHG